MDDPIEALAERVALLEAAVRDLTARVSGSEGLATNRLAIVDGAGVERIVLETVAGTASVLVRVPSPPGATTGIELYATPADDGEGPSVGLCVLREGDVVEVTDRR